MAVNRMPSCIGKTNRQIWRMFQEAYPDVDERQLREIHIRWGRVLAEVKVCR